MNPLVKAILFELENPRPAYLQNLQEQDLQNLVTWKGAGKLAGKAGKAYLGGGFQNLEQQQDLQNLVTWKGAGKLAGKAGKAYLGGGF